MDINLQIQDIAKKYGGRLNSTESKWYNGHAYLPLIEYVIEVMNDSYNLNMKYEYRLSETYKTSIIDSGSYGDRHLFTLKGMYSNLAIYNFEITESGFFKRLLKKQSNFKVKTNNIRLKETLTKNILLNNIYEYCNTDPEFSLSISGKSSKEGFIVLLNFSTKYFHYELIDNIFKFLTTFYKASEDRG